MVNRMSVLLLLLIVIVLHSNCAATAKNIIGNHADAVPVIGIFTRKIFESDPNAKDDDLYHYVAGSYVKWLESAGARSIPIHADASTEEVIAPSANNAPSPS